MFDQILLSKLNYKFFFKIQTKINQSYIIRFHTKKVDLMNSLLNCDLNIFGNTIQKKYIFSENDAIYNLINITINSEIHQMNICDVSLQCTITDKVD